MRIMTGIFGDSHADYDLNIWRKVSIEKKCVIRILFLYKRESDLLIFLYGYLISAYLLKKCQISCQKWIRTRKKYAWTEQGKYKLIFD